MQNASARMQKLIDDLLTFSRISRTQEPFEPVDFNKVVHEVLNDLEIAIESKNVKVHVGPLTVIAARNGQIRQLFQNLISNAIKFSRDNTPPEIHMHSEVKDTGSKRESRVKIKTRDNGIENSRDQVSIHATN